MLSSRRPKGGGILYRATSTLGPFVASLLRASDRREREKHPFGRLLVSSRRPKGGGILQCATSTLDPFVASLLRASERHEREKHPFGRLLVSSRAQPPLVIPTTEGRRDPTVRHLNLGSLRRFAPQGKRTTRTGKAPVRSPACVIPSTTSSRHPDDRRKEGSYSARLPTQVPRQNPPRDDSGRLASVRSPGALRRFAPQGKRTTRTERRPFGRLLSPRPSGRSRSRGCVRRRGLSARTLSKSSPPGAALAVRTAATTRLYLCPWPSRRCQAPASLRPFA